MPLATIQLLIFLSQLSFRSSSRVGLKGSLPVRSARLNRMINKLELLYS